MTTMRMTIYGVLAVAVGVALVGVLPTQLSAITGQSSRPFELQNTTSGNETIGTKQPGTESQGSSFDIIGSTDAENAQQEFNTNVMYYGLWVVNLAIALGVYFLAKRRLD